MAPATITHDPAVAQAFIEVAKEMGATRQQTLALLSAGLVESNMQAIDYGDRDSLGPLQQRPSQGWGTPEQVQDPRYAARKFLEAAMKISKFSNPGELAAQVQRPAAQYRGRYQERMDDARALWQQYRDAAGGGAAAATAPATDAPLLDLDDEDDDELDSGTILQLVLESTSDRLRQTASGESEEDTSTQDTFGELGKGSSMTSMIAQQRAEARDAANAAATEAQPPLFVPPTDSSGSMEWGGFENGKIPLDQMMAVVDADGTKHYFAPDAGAAMQQMLNDARKDGVNLSFTDSYRDYATQVRLRNEKGHQVATATPGTSIHGYGKAIDAKSESRAWLQKNGAKYGWIWPEWAQKPGKSYEPWHFEFRPGGA